MRNRLIFILSVMFFVVLLSCNKKEAVPSSEPRAASEKKVLTLKFGHLGSEENNWHKSALLFAKEVSERSNGTIQIQVFPNEQLGTEIDTLNSIPTGIADFTITGTTLEQYGATLVRIMEFPYLFRDEEHMLKAINSSPGQAITADIEQSTPYKTIAYFIRGPRELTSNRAISSLSDLQGLIIRVPNSPTSVAIWRALGAKPTPMAFSEVFTALQQGTVEAQENPLSLISDAGFAEVQKYINVTDHVRSWLYIVMSQQRFDSLNAEQQQAITESALIMQEFQHELSRAEVQQFRGLLEGQITFNENVDQDEFATRIRDVLVPELTPEQKRVYDQVQQIQ